MNIIVAKFGGTSMGDAESIGRVVSIIQADIKSHTPVVVVSAVAGVTDQLLKLGQMALGQEEWESEMISFKQRHQTIIQELGIDLDINALADELTELLRGVALVRELSPHTQDHILSFGERVSSLVLAAKLDAAGVVNTQVDTAKLIATDQNYGEAKVDFAKTDALIRAQITPLIKSNTVPVLAGFIAQSLNGSYTTLGRGGSDYTAAIVAAALGAHELKIWTDVNGIYSADPKIIKGGQVIPELSFNEASELAYFGAKVLHPKTIIPAVEKNIPIRIVNTFNPSSPGTLITRRESRGAKGIVWKKDVTIVYICSTRMLEAHGWLASIFDIFKKHQVIIDVLATSEVSLSLTVNSPPPEELIQELSKFASVTVTHGHAVMCLVGEGLRDAKGILGKLFMALQDHAVKMVSQGASGRNITFLVQQQEAEQIAQKVFDQFFVSRELSQDEFVVQ